MNRKPNVYARMSNHENEFPIKIANTLYLIKPVISINLKYCNISMQYAIIKLMVAILGEFWKKMHKPPYTNMTAKKSPKNGRINWS